MYDSEAPTFQPLPLGPFESIPAGDHQQVMAAAQQHFSGGREIKLKETRGNPLPASSYKDHYPPKQLPPKEQGPEELSRAPFPFTSRTENMDEYFAKDFGKRPVTPMTYTPKPGQTIGKETTHNATFKPFVIEPAAPTMERSRPATAPPQRINMYSTESRSQYTPKKAAAQEPRGETLVRGPMPWLNDGTTYQNQYIPKPITLRPILHDERPTPMPFEGTTEYRAEYPKKDGYATMPPLSGIKSTNGLSLPLPRRSLGVEYWNRGTPDHLFILLPRTVPAPCKASQLFTTLHDNQSTASILILYGEDPVASNNMILGQFDLVGIPPAERDVPRILVTYTLTKDLVLTAEAHDLDYDRQKAWEQRGGIVVKRV